jgi:ABC-2 type transport system ATP-binding protein
LLDGRAIMSASSAAISAKGLSKRFGEIRAVEGLDLEVRRGEIYGFLGRNGAGKTTTIRMLLGLVAPSEGEAALFGESLRSKRLGALRKVGFLVESATAYPNLTVRENLELQRRLTEAPKGAVERVIELLGLGEYAERRSSRLSLGNRQRLALARALVSSPELLVLDEPANGLDPAGIVEIRSLLRRLADEEGVTVFMSSHILSEVAELADRIGIMHRGRLVEETDRRLPRKAERVSIELRAEDAAAADIALARAGIAPLRIAPMEEDLEDRFMRLTGGEA